MIKGSKNWYSGLEPNETLNHKIGLVIGSPVTSSKKCKTYPNRDIIDQKPQIQN